MNLSIDHAEDGRFILYNEGEGFVEILHIYDTEAEAKAAKDLLAGDIFLPDEVAESLSADLEVAESCSLLERAQDYRARNLSSEARQGVQVAVSQPGSSSENAKNPGPNGAEPRRADTRGSSTIQDEETTTGAVGGSPVRLASQRLAEMPTAPTLLNSVELDIPKNATVTGAEIRGGQSGLWGKTWTQEEINRFTPTLLIPLYPQYGGPPLGFACGQCQDVTKTKIGVWRHLWRKHKIKPQRELFDETAK